MIEEKLRKHPDIPAIEYFGRIISRKEFIENVYLWARFFKKIGVQEDEVVAYYGPFMPDICYIIFALNTIGACPYFLKLSISSDALAEETKDCRFAIVFDQMWDDVKSEFSKGKYKTVVIARITDAMPMPKRLLISGLLKLKSSIDIPNNERFISVLKARNLAQKFEDETKATYVSNRKAFITSSSGTTVGGIVKGIVATNETAIRLIYSEISSNIPVSIGDRTLNHFPPTAATSILSLFLMPLFCGATIVIDPRVSEKDFYNQIIKLKPNVVLTTGSAWEAFFNRIIEDKRNGISHHFDNATYWIVGGEGSDIDKIKKWDDLLIASNGDPLYSGYGQSELFSTVSVENKKARYDFSNSVMSVGIPLAGIIVGVFDKKGEELSYNQRGELWIKSKTAMQGYYNKPELTARTKVDGWIRTGDMAEIDDNGFVFIYGRMTDYVENDSGEGIYLFDISDKIKEIRGVDDAIIVPVSGDYYRKELSLHIVWNIALSNSEKEENLKRIKKDIFAMLPLGIKIIGYAEYEKMLPYSPTTLKKDKNKMSQVTNLKEF